MAICNSYVCSHGVHMKTAYKRGVHIAHLQAAIMKPQVILFVIALSAFQLVFAAKVPLLKDRFAFTALKNTADSMKDKVKGAAGALKSKVTDHFTSFKGSVIDYMSQSAYKAILKEAGVQERDISTSLTAGALVSEITNKHDQDGLLRAAEKAIEMKKTLITIQLLDSLFSHENHNINTILARLLEDKRYPLLQYALPAAKVDKYTILNKILLHIEQSILELKYPDFKCLIKGMKAAYGPSIYSDLEHGENKLFVSVFATGADIADSPQKLKILEKMLLKVSKEFSVPCQDIEDVIDFAQHYRDNKDFASIFALLKRLSKPCNSIDSSSVDSLVKNPLHLESDSFSTKGSSHASETFYTNWSDEDLNSIHIENPFEHETKVE